MKRAKGATIAEIMAAMKWQAHTVRCFVSILINSNLDKVKEKLMTLDLAPVAQWPYSR
jgi:Protein of unknown function (DUF3489)